MLTSSFLARYTLFTIWLEFSSLAAANCTIREGQEAGVAMCGVSTRGFATGEETNAQQNVPSQTTAVARRLRSRWETTALDGCRRALDESGC
jgi:hypothetical protein